LLGPQQAQCRQEANQDIFFQAITALNCKIKICLCSHADTTLPNSCVSTRERILITFSMISLRQSRPSNLNMHSLNFSLVCIFIAFVGAQHIADNPCPERPIQQSFDIVKVIQSHSWQLIRQRTAFFLFGGSTHLALGMTCCDIRRISRSAAIAASQITI